MSPRRAHKTPKLVLHESSSLGTQGKAPFWKDPPFYSWSSFSPSSFLMPMHWDSQKTTSKLPRRRAPISTSMSFALSVIRTSRPSIQKTIVNIGLNWLLSLTTSKEGPISCVLRPRLLTENLLFNTVESWGCLIKTAQKQLKVALLGRCST